MPQNTADAAPRRPTRRRCLPRLRLSPRTTAVVISAGIASGVAAVLLLAIALGIIVTPRSTELIERKIIGEQLALNCVTHDLEHHADVVRQLIRAVCDRYDDVLSGAVRKADGTLLVEVGDHARLWQSQESGLSTAEQVQVPIYSGDGAVWGTVELRFRPLPARTLLSRIVPLPVVLAAATTFLITLVYLLRLGRKVNEAYANEVPARVRATLDTLAEGVLLLDKNRRIALANQAFSQAMGQPVDELEGRLIDELPWADSDSDRTPDELPWSKAITDHDAHLGAVVGLKQDSRVRRKFSVNSLPLVTDDGGCRGVLATFDDLTGVERRNAQLRKVLKRLEKSRAEIREQNEQLQTLATTDPLTGCLNRRSFFSELEKYDSGARRYGYPLACVMLDVDRFKSINDRYGHLVGDQVLQNVAEALKSTLRQSDLVCRYGGEEFCVLLPHIDIHQAVQAGERIREAVEAVRVSDVSVTASLGVTAKSLGASNPQALLDQADKCLYVAKRTGRNRVVRFDDLPDHVETGTLRQDKSRLPEADDAARPVPFQAVAALVSALAFRDLETAEHSKRVADLCVAAAEGLLSLPECYLLETAALLHDIGKIGVPDSILLKPGPLTEDEWDVMSSHARIGVQIIRSSFASEELSDIVEAYYASVETDGPAPLNGSDTPQSARMLAIADAYDSMVSPHSYREPYKPEEAFAELRRCAGTQFDPQLVERFITVVRDQNAAQGSGPSDVSTEALLTIGRQSDELARAVERQDFDDLQLITSRLRATAFRQGVNDVAQRAAELETELATDPDPFAHLEAADRLLQLCRSTQASHLPKRKR